MGYDNPLQNEYEGDDGWDWRQGAKIAPSSPSYTLAELMELAKQWRDEEDGVDSHAQWAVSSLLAWLAKREQGEVKGR